MGTVNLLDIAFNVKSVQVVMVVTTDKVYKNDDSGHSFIESDPLEGKDPYSASKVGTESVVNAWQQIAVVSGGPKVVSVRAGNVIGGGDRSEDRLIPDIVKALSNDIPVPIRNPNSIRPWQHVLEPLFGYLLLGTYMKDNPLKYSTAFNFGPMHNDHLKVRELLDISINSWGSGKWEDHSNMQEPHEAGILMLDINKAMSELGWTPKLNAIQAIEWTIDWYKKSDAEKAEFTYYQIHQFLSL
jgi:CDP-glucose 4,6-dehydratase